MGVSADVNRSYGFSSGFFVSPKSGSQSVVIGAVAENGGRWTRVLSLRAAHLLWFHFARFLFPERAENFTAGIMTAISRADEQPSITDHLVVHAVTHDIYEIIGSVSGQSWVFQVHNQDAHHLWSVLDVALFPAQH
jgi:hypothetical protein